MNSIERLIERVNSLGDEVQRLIEGLVRRNMRERAGAVERAMGEVVEGCGKAIGEVYGAAEGVGVGPREQGVGIGGVEGQAEGDFRPMGADATLWASMEEVSKKREPPVVRAFGRLSLLG